MKKVLVVASEIYCNSLPPQAITGLSIMVRDIYNEVSRYYNSYLLSSYYALDNEEISQNLHILDSHTNNLKKFVKIKDILNSLYYLPKGFSQVKSYIKEQAKIRAQLHNFIYYLSTIKPDIVSFHEFDNLNTVLLKYCVKRDIKCVITNHLYIGNSFGCDNYSDLKRNESILLTMRNINISAICTGMRNRMLVDYPLLNPQKVYLTINGTNFINDVKENNCIYDKLVDNRKVILCIANVMKRKNQIQLVSAISEMPKDTRDKFVIYFLGTDYNNELQDAINKYNCHETCHYKGKVRSEEMIAYYQNAHAVITTTYCEGFGLTIIEGYSYGLPAIIPNDIDSFSDLYDSECSVEIKGRRNLDISNAISEFLSKKWKPELIVNKAKTFSMQKCGKSYVDMYNSIINTK